MPLRWLSSALPFAQQRNVLGFPWRLGAPPPQFGVRRGGLAPQRSLGGQGDAGTPAPGGEHRCSRGTGGKGELEAAGGQMPRTGTGRVEGGECINRK